MATDIPTTNPPARLQNANIIGSVRLPAPLPDGVDAEDCYATQLIGDCLEPVVYEGDRIVAAQGAHPRNGDYVVLWFKDHETPLVKRAVMIPPADLMKVGKGSDVVPIIVVEQLNPPRQYSTTVDKIEDMHLVIGVARAGSEDAVPMDVHLKSVEAA